MVDVVTSLNRMYYEKALENMFTMRHHVAINELGWTIPGQGTGKDKDQFDTDDTIYFLEFDETGRVIGTARLNPTTRPHLLTDIFPELCDLQSPPVGDDIFEYSRFMVLRKGVPKDVHLRTRVRITLAIIEYCVSAGINKISWVTYKQKYPIAVDMWNTRPLGLPRHFEDDNADYIAAVSDMTPEGLARTRDIARIQTPVCSMTLPLQQVPVNLRQPKRAAVNFG